MKKIIAALFVTLVLLVGCNDQSSITSPDVADSPQWIELRTSSLGKIEADYVEKEINGAKGGWILFKYGYLRIPRKAFSGTEVISVSNDRKLAVLDFGPEMNFDKSLRLSAIYTNLDLSGVNPSDVEFGYIGENGFEPVKYSRLVVNVKAGILAVYGAKLNHFSRYGWLR